MSHPSYIEDYSDSELVEELQRRHGLRLQGLCPNCHREYAQPECSHPEQHRAVAPERLTLEQLQALGDSLAVAPAREILGLVGETAGAATGALIDALLKAAAPSEQMTLLVLLTQATKQLAGGGAE